VDQRCVEAIASATGGQRARSEGTDGVRGGGGEAAVNLGGHVLMDG
jgi:hypothetical protein